MNSHYFEDFRLGDRFTTASVTVTEDQIVEFGRRWDPYPFHTDPSAAKAHHFDGLVASGFHTLSLSFRLFAQSGLLLTSVVSGVRLDEVRWPRPVRPGDTLHATAEVLALKPSRRRPRWGTVTLGHKTFNQRDEMVMTAECDHIVSRRESGVN